MREVTEALSRIIVTLIIGGALVFVALIAERNFQQYLRVQALSQCYSASQVTFKDTAGAEITETIKSAYKACVEDKGFTTNIQ